MGRRTVRKNWAISMRQNFSGWSEVADHLRTQARKLKVRAEANDQGRLNRGQRASLLAIADRIERNGGIVLADEVGMGKTRIAVELIRSVTKSGGRVVILMPPGLGPQWQAELRNGGLVAPQILRSLWQYLRAWEAEDPSKHRPWFDQQIVLLSHSFTNWRLGKNSESWRWALLPELYALWRKKISGRLPRGYVNHKKLDDLWVCNAAESICNAISIDARLQSFELMENLSAEMQWPSALKGSEYESNNTLRPFLERAVGLGLGTFDLIVIDEAHKSRGKGSTLTTLLDKVVLPSSSARRFAMTATPVELDISQWTQILNRIGLNATILEPITAAVSSYADAVRNIRQSPTSETALGAYRKASKEFQKELSPYILRRDKREDPAIESFREHSRLAFDEYRHEMEISIETNDLSLPWREVVCASEALSLVTKGSSDPLAKRLRLTMGNGHGISALIASIRRDEKADKKQEEFEQLLENSNATSDPVNDDPKRIARAEWWMNVLNSSLTDEDKARFDHPTLHAAVQAIEKVTNSGGKVLVFGRFTLPLRDLVSYLNAREMLRCLECGRLWPQSKMRASADRSELIAIEAAHRDLKSPISLEDLDERLEAQYEKLRSRRKRLQTKLIGRIEAGLTTQERDPRIKTLFESFKKSINRKVEDDDDSHPLAIISRALDELMEGEAETCPTEELARAFGQILEAFIDRDDFESFSIDHDDRNASDNGRTDYRTRADGLWLTFMTRLREDYGQQQGTFARLMYGDTTSQSRRMIQLAFNRPRSFPKVLVAQSLVGREGLNLHEACRTIILLHHEWNPAVVEQQIGRVDRVGSQWEKDLTVALEEGKSGESLPRIDIRQIIFKGTYDEYHWGVLRERWDELRAQLHGVVIPRRLANFDSESRRRAEEISKAAPNFSPSPSYPNA